MDYRVFYFEPVPRSSETFLLQVNERFIMANPSLRPFLRLLVKDETLPLIQRRLEQNEVKGNESMVSMYKKAKEILGRVDAAWPIRRVFINKKDRLQAMLEGKNGQLVHANFATSTLQVVEDDQGFYQKTYIVLEEEEMHQQIEQYKNLLDTLSF